MGTEKPWYVPGKWFVSNYNWAEGVRQQMPNLPKKIKIRDVTLREALVAEVDKQVALNKSLMARKKRGYLMEEEFEKLIQKVIRR